MPGLLVDWARHRLAGRPSLAVGRRFVYFVGVLAGGADVPQEQDRQQGGASGEDGGDDDIDLEALGERLAGGLGKVNTGLSGKGGRHVQRAAERVTGGCRIRLRNTSRERTIERSPIDGGADAAEDGDADRQAELLTRF